MVGLIQVADRGRGKLSRQINQSSHSPLHEIPSTVRENGVSKAPLQSLHSSRKGQVRPRHVEYMRPSGRLQGLHTRLHLAQSGSVHPWHGGNHHLPDGEMAEGERLPVAERVVRRRWREDGEDCRPVLVRVSGRTGWHEVEKVLWTRGLDFQRELVFPC